MKAATARSATPWAPAAVQVYELRNPDDTGIAMYNHWQFSLYNQWRYVARMISRYLTRCVDVHRPRRRIGRAITYKVLLTSWHRPFQVCATGRHYNFMAALRGESSRYNLHWVALIIWTNVASSAAYIPV